MAKTADTELLSTAVGRTSLPYAPSWVDHLTDGVRRLPGPSWAFYLGLGLVLFALEMALKFADKTYVEFWDFNPLHGVFVLNVLYYLALLHYLDEVAGRALASFRPALDGDEALHQSLHYQLTTLPARPTFFAGLLGGLYGVFLFFVTPEELKDQAALLTSPAAAVLEVTTNILGWCVMGVFFYHTVRQLRLVSRIYAQHARISIFEQGSLYAFSWLTARTALGLILNIYAWAAAFVWPLLGAHRLLMAEKERRRTALARRMDATIAMLQHRLDGGDLAEMTGLKDALESLVVAQNELDKIRTWPWQPGTLRGLATAVLLPLLLWLITRLLERLVTF